MIADMIYIKVLKKTNYIVVQKSCTYGEDLFLENAKVKSASRILIFRETEHEELVQCSKEARRADMMQQCCRQPSGESSTGSFLQEVVFFDRKFVLVRFISLVVLKAFKGVVLNF